MSTKNPTGFTILFDTGATPAQSAGSAQKRTANGDANKRGSRSGRKRAATAATGTRQQPKAAQGPASGARSPAGATKSAKSPKPSILKLPQGAPWIARDLERIYTNMFCVAFDKARTKSSHVSAAVQGQLPTRFPEKAKLVEALEAQSDKNVFNAMVTMFQFKNYNNKRAKEAMVVPYALGLSQAFFMVFSHKVVSLLNDQNQLMTYYETLGTHVVEFGDQVTKFDFMSVPSLKAENNEAAAEAAGEALKLLLSHAQCCVAWLKNLIASAYPNNETTLEGYTEAENVVKDVDARKHQSVLAYACATYKTTQTKTSSSKAKGAGQPDMVDLLF